MELMELMELQRKFWITLTSMKKYHSLALLCAAAVLVGCGSTPHVAAPVVERAPASGQPAAKPAPAAKPPAVPEPAPVRAADPYGSYTVKKGDTLTRIALDHGQNYRDLVAWNNLVNPNDIKVDQVLRVLPPDASLSGAQTSAVPAPDTRPRPAAGAVGGAPAGNLKAGPRGDKVAYSDSALAEMQKPEGAAASVGVGAGTAPAAKPPTKPAPAAPSAEDEALTWIWPSEGKVVATFDEGKSKGIDIAGKLGQQVLAASSGKVMYAGNSIRGYGNLVIVKHTSNLLSAYAHNKAILVKEGDSVGKGQVIAEMGNSDADSVKLHFEIRQQGKPVDPSRFLPGR